MTAARKTEKWPKLYSGESKKDGGSPRKKEMSMEIRLLLSFALMGAIVCLSHHISTRRLRRLPSLSKTHPDPSG